VEQVFIEFSEQYFAMRLVAQTDPECAEPGYGFRQLWVISGSLLICTVECVPQLSTDAARDDGHLPVKSP
jgi:hypothetical protein